MKWRRLTWARGGFVYHRRRLWCVVCQRRSLFLLGSPCMCLFCPAPSVAPSSPWSARRAFLLAAGASAAAPVLAQVEVGSASSLRKLVPAETLENSAAQQYQQMLQQAKAKRALAPSDHPQLQRLHAIAKRLIPHTMPWNDRAKQWSREGGLVFLSTHPSGPARIGELEVNVPKVQGL